MRRSLLGLGLVIGLFFGCSTGPSGVDGLCDLLNQCGSANFDDLADCVDSINKCEGADDRANGCINLNGCEEHDACAYGLAVDCAIEPPAEMTGGATTAAESTGDDPTTQPQPDETTNVDPSTTGGPVDPSTTSGPGESTGETGVGATSETTMDPTVDPVEECKMGADQQTACSDCACENCLEQTLACRADEGCRAIRKCAQDNNCSGVGCLGPCGPVINMYGGFGGMSAQLGLDLSGCVEEYCMAECA